jgi:hypothetical protein
MIRNNHHIGPCPELGLGKGDRHLFQAIEKSSDLIGVSQYPEKEFLNPGQMIRERPWAHDLSYECDMISVVSPIFPRLLMT